MGLMLPLLTLLLVQTCLAANIIAVAPWVVTSKGTDTGVSRVVCRDERHGTTWRCHDDYDFPIAFINLGQKSHEADLCAPGYFA